MKAHAFLSESGNTLLHILVGVVVIGAIGLVGWRVVDHNKKPVAVTPTSTTQAATTTASPTTLTTGSDNASLNADVTAIGTDQGQASSNLQSSNSALNDQQSEVQVPTN